MASADGNEMLAEPGAGKFTMIDNKKKEYYVVTKQDMEAASAAMAARMKEMEPQIKKAQEAMKNVPPEMQQKMAGLMGGLAATVNVQKGPGTRTIAGYKCDNWTVSIGEMTRTEECLTTEVTYPPQVWAAYKEFAESMKQALTAMGPMSQGISQMQEKMKDMKGLPLATTTTTKLMGKASTSSQEVTAIKKGAIPASAWQIPADYKQVESPMARMAKKK
jgi:prefoldin subunit 5